MLNKFNKKKNFIPYLASYAMIDVCHVVFAVADDKWLLHDSHHYQLHFRRQYYRRTQTSIDYCSSKRLVLMGTVMILVMGSGNDRLLLVLLAHMILFLIDFLDIYPADMSNRMQTKYSLNLNDKIYQSSEDNKMYKL